MTVEMSIAGSLCLLLSTSKSPDGEAIRQHGFFYGWTPLTLVIILLHLSKKKKKTLVIILLVYRKVIKIDSIFMLFFL
jgi:hypothetical protein